MDNLVKIIEIANPVTLTAMGIMFLFFYQRMEIKIDKVEARIDKVETKLRNEMLANTREINSRIDSLYNFVFTLCGYKQQNNNDDKAA